MVNYFERRDRIPEERRYEERRYEMIPLFTMYEQHMIQKHKLRTVLCMHLIISLYFWLDRLEHLAEAPEAD